MRSRGVAVVDMPEPRRGRADLAAVVHPESDPFVIDRSDGCELAVGDFERTVGSPKLNPVADGKRAGLRPENFDASEALRRVFNGHVRARSDRQPVVANIGRLDRGVAAALDPELHAASPEANHVALRVMA